MFCPKCKSEYREGFTWCHDCQVDLVAELPPETNNVTKRDLIMLASFWSLLDADLLRMRLEVEGIDCFLFDEKFVQMNWGCSNAIGGVKVYIDSKDIIKAQEIIKAESETDLELELELESENKCPECFSTNIAFDKFSRLPFFLGWLLFSIPLPFLKYKWKCLKCGHTWKNNSPI